jgi:GntR family transcriptional regulator
MNREIVREPLYIAVKNRIWDEITEGRFPDTLPTEHELCDIYKVSRSTIRSAIQELKKENVVRTVHGIGTFVNKSGSRLRMRIDKFNGFYQLVEESDRKPSVEDIGHHELPCLDVDFDLPADFTDGPVVVFERIVKSDDQPAIYVQEFVPKASLKPQADLDRLADSIYQIVDQITHTHISYTISEIVPVLAQGTVARHFGIPLNIPINMVRERHFNSHDEVVVYSEAFVNCNVIRFNILRTE